MSVPAGLLNRKALFLRRSLMPTLGEVTRGGYVVLGQAQWAGYRPRGAKETTIGGLQLQLSTGVLTVRNNAFTRTITTSDQVQIDGETYEIVNRQIGERPEGVIRFDIQTAPSQDTYAREFEARGEVVTVRRIVANAPAIDAIARAIVTGYRPEELVGGIMAGHRRIILSAEDLEAAGWPAPPRPNDKIMVRGRQLNVLSVDDSTHRSASILHAYEIQAAS